MAGHAVAAEDLLAGYLGELSARLCGPRSRRRRIVAEIRDGILDAAAARAARGQDTGTALSAAIGEFGAPARVAAAFAPELIIGYARRTLAWYAATGPLVGIWWLLAVWPEHGRMADALTAIPVRPFIVVAIVTALAVAATTGRAMRWLPETGARRALLAVAAVVVVVAGADLVMLARYASGAIAPGKSVAMVAAAASLARICCAARVLAASAELRHRLADPAAVPEGHHAGR